MPLESAASNSLDKFRSELARLLVTNPDDPRVLELREILGLEVPPVTVKPGKIRSTNPGAARPDSPPLRRRFRGQVEQKPPSE